MAEFVKIDERGLAAARARGQAEYACPRAISGHFDFEKGLVVIELEMGGRIVFDPRALNGLQEASVGELADIVVDGAGFTLSFPRVDADFGLPYLVKKFGAVTEAFGAASAL